MTRLAAVLAALCLGAAALASSSTAAPRMLVGFQDDPNFRLIPERTSALDRAQQTHATVIRTIVYWSQIAPERPARPANPFAPEYRFGDLDELVRNAKARGMRVLMAIWGTPGWANGGRGENRLPSRLADATAFARALAARYSGRFPGLPASRLFSVWNESNLEQFLAPQFSRGKSMSPGLYAKLYRALYKGLKRGNPRALVAIGETSPRGRDHPSLGPIQDSHSPGLFARRVAEACRGKCKFDAYAHHPYPTTLTSRPTQRVLWPNVTLSSMRRFENSLAGWFRLEKPPRIWITEYGHQTRPPQTDGVSPAVQAKYVTQALALARADEFVDMFIWFIFRDDSGDLGQWQSGLYNGDWTAKPALARWTSFAAGIARPRRL